MVIKRRPLGEHNLVREQVWFGEIAAYKAEDHLRSDSVTMAPARRAPRLGPVCLGVVFVLMIDAKVYDRCELAHELRSVHRVPDREVATWVCIAKYESHFNTSAVNRASGDHGLFQISDLYWCSPPGGGFACGAPCAAFEDDDIADDVACIRRIFNEHQLLSGDGFNAWAVYPRHCSGDVTGHVEGCGGGAGAGNAVDGATPDGGDGYEFPPLPAKPSHSAQLDEGRFRHRHSLDPLPGVAEAHQRYRPLFKLNPNNPFLFSANKPPSATVGPQREQFGFTLNPNNPFFATPPKPPSTTRKPPAEHHQFTLNPNNPFFAKPATTTAKLPEFSTFSPTPKRVFSGKKPSIARKPSAGGAKPASTHKPFYHTPKTPFYYVSRTPAYSASALTTPPKPPSAAYYGYRTTTLKPSNFGTKSTNSYYTKAFAISTPKPITNGRSFTLFPARKTDTTRNYSWAVKNSFVKYSNQNATKPQRKFASFEQSTKTYDFAKNFNSIVTKPVSSIYNYPHFNQKSEQTFYGNKVNYSFVRRASGAPVLLSFPHFLYADKEYQDSLVGIHPDAKKHETFVTLEPTSGVPLQMAKRVQFSMFIRPIEDIESIQNVTNGLIPMFWIEESMVLNDDFIQMLKSQLLNILLILDIIKWTLILFGIASISASLLMIICKNE